MKTIKQLSEELKISKDTIYRKIRYQLKEPLEGHVTKISNITHIDDVGENIIIQSLNKERRDVLQEIIQTEEHKPITERQPHVNEYINLLQEQLRIKDRQLDVQSSHIDQLINQLGANQLLLKSEQYKSIMYLQSDKTNIKETLKPKLAPFWKRILKI